MQGIYLSIRLGLRSGIVKALLVLAMLAIAAAVFMAAFSGRQPTTLVLDTGFSLLRFLLCVSGLFWLQEILGKPIEKRFIVQILAFPQPALAVPYFQLLRRWYRGIADVDSGSCRAVIRRSCGQYL